MGRQFVFGGHFSNLEEILPSCKLDDRRHSSKDDLQDLFTNRKGLGQQGRGGLAFNVFLGEAGRFLDQRILSHPGQALFREVYLITKSLGRDFQLGQVGSDGAQLLSYTFDFLCQKSKRVPCIVRGIDR